MSAQNCLLTSTSMKQKTSSRFVAPVEKTLTYCRLLFGEAVAGRPPERLVFQNHAAQGPAAPNFCVQCRSRRECQAPSHSDRQAPVPAVGTSTVTTSSCTPENYDTGFCTTGKLVVPFSVPVFDFSTPWLMKIRQTSYRCFHENLAKHDSVLHSVDRIKNMIRVGTVVSQVLRELLEL